MSQSSDARGAGDEQMDVHLDPSDDGDSCPLTEQDKTPAPMKYEYLDHTADVQIHAWGDNLTEAFEQAGVALFGYMTDIDTVSIESVQEVEVTDAEDMLGLLYRYLDELLFLFCAEPFFIARKVKITQFDRENFRIKAKAYGETFSLDKHPQGTEVKAITYSNMQVHDTDESHEVFVIIDI